MRNDAIYVVVAGTGQGRKNIAAYTAKADAERHVDGYNTFAAAPLSQYGAHLDEVTLDPNRPRVFAPIQHIRELFRLQPPRVVQATFRALNMVEGGRGGVLALSGVMRESPRRACAMAEGILSALRSRKEKYHA